MGAEISLANRDVAETALRSDEFALGSACVVVTSRKLVRFAGNAVHIEAPATVRRLQIEKRIVNSGTDRMNRSQVVQALFRRNTSNIEV